MLEAKLFIDGKWTDAADGEQLIVCDPSNGQPIARVAEGGPSDVDAAVQAARRTFDEGNWPYEIAPRDRARILLDAALSLQDKREHLALLETMNCGKPIAEASADIDEAAAILEYYAGWITKLGGELPPVGPDALSLITFDPVGVAGLITPWNYPLLLAVQKVAPALAAGCAVILKPAEQTPLTALELGKILMEAGAPSGSLNIITGYGDKAGRRLVAHPGVEKISFTGSLAVGQEIIRRSAETLKRVTLELGGKSPNIVFADADLRGAVVSTAQGVFKNQGEVCSAGSRVLVEHKIYDEFLQGLVEEARRIKLGCGQDPTVTMGPLITREHQLGVQNYIERGLEDGSKLAFQGELPEDPNLRNGFFVPPCIFYDVDNKTQLAQEEVFGPVMAVMPFKSVDEAISIANATRYGLAAAIWTQHLAKALHCARRIRAGTIWINDSQQGPAEAPWGGYKQSGLGRELGRHGIEDFLETKHIFVRTRYQ